jgi:two-component system response regulator ResD
MRIVVADDDPAVRNLMIFHLNCEGFETVEAADGCAALRQVREGAELVILDLGLPGVDGLGVMRAIRGENLTVPVLVLSGRTEEIDRVVTFELGADDFVIKPFFPREVICRVRAILRRKTAEIERTTRVLQFGRLELDEGARVARVDGIDVGLRPKEFSLLWALASNPGVVLSRKTLLQKVWGFDFDGDDRTVDGHVRRVRTKIEEQMNLPPCLTTIYGYGYKFVAA